MPTQRRPKTRPTAAVAFCAASAVLSIPPPEQSTIRSLTKSTRLTPDCLSHLLHRLNLRDAGFARALFTLCDVNGSGHVPLNTFLIAYAVLRRLALAAGEDALCAAQEAAWLAFCAAGGGFDAERLTWDRWEPFVCTLGECIGGVESLPCNVSKEQMRRAWRKAKPTFAGGLPFDRLVAVLRRYDGGLVHCLKATGYLLSCAVIDAGQGFVERPIWRGEEESVFLCQFLTFAIRRASGKNDSADERSPMSSGDVQRLSMGGKSPQPGADARPAAPSWNSPQSNTDAKLRTSALERSVGNTTADQHLLAEKQPMADRKISPKPRVQFGGLRPTPGSVQTPGDDESPTSIVHTSSPTGSTSSSVTLGMVRRTAKTNGKTPFHIDFSSLKLGEQIGSGAYGDVYRGTFLMSPVAVKMFHVNLNTQQGDDQDPSQLNRMSTMSALQRFASVNSQAKYRNFVREVEMMSVVRHPNLVLYMGACGDPVTPLCIVSELFTGGSMYEFLHNEAEFRPPLYMAVNFALNIARGMFYLHSSQPSILHRDLKSRNVLLSGRKSVDDGTPHVVICDFGLCQLFGEEGQSGNQMGTASYMSPDVVSGEKYQASDDVYSYGVLLHEIFTGCVPYEGMRAMQVMFRVANDGLRPSCEQDSVIPENVQALMMACWHEDRQKRPAFDDIIARLTEIEASLKSSISEVC